MQELSEKLGQEINAQIFEFGVTVSVPGISIPLSFSPSKPPVCITQSDVLDKMDRFIGRCFGSEIAYIHIEIMFLFVHPSSIESLVGVADMTADSW